MNSHKKSPIYFLGWLAFLIILSGVMWKNFRGWQVEVDPHLLNQKIPAFDLPILSQSKTHLTNHDLVGRVILLNFWASWCSACRAENDTLQKIAHEYHVPIYGINYKDDPNNARNWLKQSGNPYVVSGVDANGTAGVEFALYGTPETFVIDAKGIIRHVHLGTIDEAVWQNELWPIVQGLLTTPS